MQKTDYTSSNVHNYCPFAVLTPLFSANQWNPCKERRYMFSTLTTSDSLKNTVTSSKIDYSTTAITVGYIS